MAEEATDYPPLPYTHYCYLPSEKAAQALAADLRAADFAVRIHELDETPSHAPDGTPNWWLLLADKPVAVAELIERHEFVERLVESHGGDHDGGEATYDFGPPAPDAASTQPPGPDPPPSSGPAHDQGAHDPPAARRAASRAFNANDAGHSAGRLPDEQAGSANTHDPRHPSGWRETSRGR